MRVSGKLERSRELKSFLQNLDSPKLQAAGARGLNEHTEEQRRQSTTRIAAYTGVPIARVRGKTRIKKARAGADMAATVITADVAIPLSEYGSPVWVRDMKPGWRGGRVSSMAGAEATGWNVRRIFAGTWVAKGQVYRREDPNDPRSRPVRLYGAVLANELAKPTRPNVPAAEKFARLDLEKRVTRHVIRALGT
ncbi:hypothetical protein [Roseibium alexandrii]|uniref:hypothetical protein n=1 Tax=Roseibium alexandrii TaxID=388408 RepID=UPI003750EA71